MSHSAIRVAPTARRYGSPQTNLLLRVTGIVGAAAIPAALLVPDVGALVPFALYSMWANGPWSPVLPASHEPVLLLYGRMYDPLVVGVIATASIVMVEWINYHIYATVADLEALQRVRHGHTATRLTRLFCRRPFLAVVVAAVTPVPFWIVRVLAANVRYPLRRYLPATAIGRFPRMWFFAALGTPLVIPDSWLVIATVGSIAIGACLLVGRGLVGRAGRSRRESVGSGPGLGSRTAGAVAACGMLIASALPARAQEAIELSLTGTARAVEAFDPATVLRVPVAPRETLAVTVTGDGPPVVMLPGLFGSAFGFRQLVPLLRDSGYRAVVIEPLGIGWSSRPNRSDYSLTAQAARIAAVLDSLDVGPAIVVAHSVGASIAFRLALLRPELVAGIVSLEGGPAEEAATPGFRRAMRWAPWLRLFGGRGLVRNKIHETLVRSSADTSWVTDSVVAGYFRALEDDFGAAIGAYYRMAESREPWKLQPRLGELRCPVLLVIGAAPHEGGPRPDEIVLLRDSLAAFAVDSLAGVGHFPYEEAPATVAAQVRRMDGGLRLARAWASVP